MTMKFIFGLSLLFLLGFSACQPNSPLTGNIQFSTPSSWHPVIYLIQANNLDDLGSSYVGQVIDSAIIQADGYFAFAKMPDASQPIILQLAVQKKGERYANQFNHLPQTANYFPIIWQNGEQIHLKANIHQFQSSLQMPKASAVNKAILELRDIRLKAFDQYLATELDEEQILEKEEQLLLYQKALMTFAEQSESFLTAMLALRWISPENDFERIPEFLFQQCEKWQNTSHPWAAQLCQKAQPENLPILIGSQLNNYSLPMLAGDTMYLNELKGEKLTLLDFWASWCAPCRHENKEVLRPLWDEFHESGFQIIGYALDSSEKAWKKAVEKDKAGPWLHSSHLQGDDAPFLAFLRIQTIPSNLLLDAEGKVLAKNLHGSALKNFVQDYFD
jgi:thiol-disulfide isomerase/thioredoxin